jgi:hypothetical protein
MSKALVRSAVAAFLVSLAATPAPVPDAYTVAFSTYFGGSGFEQVRDVTSDAAGNVYITGGTGSTNFPTTAGAYQRTNKGWFDIFVVKFNPAGQVVWSTLLGGPGYDRAYGIEVDNAGYVYLSGRSGPGFPTTPGVLQTTYQGYYTGSAYGDQNAFIAKLKPDGSGLVWATYFGTAAMNRDFDINRTTGEIWVGSTYEPAGGQAPIPSAWFANGFRKTPVGGDDNVVAKIKSDGTQVLWATYIGGTGNESGKNSLRVDPSGNVHLFTNTSSTDMPVVNAYQPALKGQSDFYLAKIRADGAALLFSTYFGGSDVDWCETHHLALDGSGNVFISGITQSTDLPTTAGAFQRTFGGINGKTNFHATGDGYVAKFSPTGQLLASSYLGGRYGDGAQGLACDGQGNVYFCGGTVSDNLPVTPGAYQSTFRGVEDFMAVKMSADLSQVLYCTYIGSTVYDEGRVCWAESDGTFYMAGESEGTNWPVKNAAQPTYGGGTGDNILVKFVPSATSLPVVSVTATDAAASEPGTDTGTFSISRTGATTTALTVSFAVTGTATSGTDYTSIGTSVTIAAGQTSAVVTVSPLDDTAVEGNETVILTLSANAAYTVGSPSSGTVTIADNDTPPSLPVVSVTATDGSASEPGTDKGTITITRTGATTAALTVAFAVTGTATSGTDYISIGTSAIIAAGQSSAVITISPLDDTAVEGSETVIVTLSANAAYTVGTPSSATVTIADNDSAPTLPVVTVTATDSSASEPGTDKGTFTVTRTGSTAAALAVSFTVGGTATSGTDYSALGSSVTIPAGATSAAVTVSPLDDALPEGNETVILTLSTSAAYTIGTPSSATVTITDNDGAPGLKGEYYSGTNFNTLVLTRTDATVDFSWGAGSPDPLVPADNFSVRWTGRVTPPQTGTYTFYTVTDDGVRLWVNGVLLVDKWVDQGPTEWSGSIALDAGKSYTIEMDYYEHASGAVAQLLWSSASVPKGVVPPAQLLSTTGLPPGGDLDGDGIPDLQDDDRDGDGWTNLDEMTWATDPDDSTSHPAPGTGGHGGGGGGHGGCGLTGLEVIALLGVAALRRRPRPRP